MAILIETGTEPVNAVEREMIALLAEELPDVHYVIPNVSLSQGKGRHPYEYDAIVVAPHAVYVVEIKGWYGDIQEISHGEWCLSSGRYVKNPLNLTDQKAKILAGLLERLELHDSHGNRLGRPYVDACLLVGSDDTQFHVSSELRRCLTPSGAADFFRDPFRLPFPKVKAKKTINKYKHVTKKLASFIAGKVEAREGGPRTFGNFVVKDSIEQTEDTTVFIAKHAQFDDGRIYRLRTWYLSSYTLTPEERAEREKTLKRSAEALHTAGSRPNIVKLLQYGEQEGSFFEVTDWSDTGTLATLISLGKNQQMTTERKLKVLRGLLRGLTAAAEHGIIHRNLNPDAILIGANGEPKIGMFDRAFMLQSSHTVYADTASLEAREYIAPEIQDIVDYDVFDSTDVYSVGVIAFELFTSHVPSMVGFSREAMEEQLRSAGIEDEVEDEIVDFVFQCMEKEPQSRPSTPATALEAVDDLLSTLRGDAAPARPTDGAVDDHEADDKIEVGAESDPTLERQRRGEFEEGERIDGSNIVRGLLGTGAHSHVYLVENEIHGSEFALKIVDATCEDANAPLREFGLLRSVGHPKVVHATWAGRHQMEGRLQPAYILLNVVRGKTLDQWLEDYDLSEEEAIGWALDLLDALKHVHPQPGEDPGAGILHRDIKPANIIVTESGPVLFDFSTACHVDDAGDTPVGTLRYTPPDLADGGWDTSCDTFAIGCLLYEMLTANPPWGSDAPSDRPVESLKTMLPNIKASVASTVDKAIAPSRECRYRTAAEFARELEEASKRERTKQKPTVFATASLQGAREALWGHLFVDELLNSPDILTPLYKAMRESVYAQPLDDLAEIETAFIEAEARMMALEEPLYETAPSVYDKLTERRAPTTVTGEALPPVGDGDYVLLVDRLSPFDTTTLLHAFRAERDVTEYLWCAGNADPLLRDDLDDAVQSFAPEIEGAKTAASLDDIGELTTRPVRWQLPPGNRGDAGLSTLLTRRHEQLQSIASELSALDGRTIVIATYGCIYLGHGLRHDVGAGMPNADRVRQAWAGAFSAGRVSRGDAQLSASVARPIRRAGNRYFPIGRLAWPDSPEAPRLFSGGMSLAERLLPILVVEPKS